MTIWIDADSCPKLVREFVLKYAENKKLSVIFVANKEIPSSKSNFKMIICPQEQDAADDYIVNNVQENDLVITRDIPLAVRLVDKSITTINDRGTSFTKDNIKQKLSDRDFDLQLAQIGLGGFKPNTYDKKLLTKFINCFDREITKIIHREH
ncbi:MAG: DUF188 domain-containing protein [Treponema sp.]|nr:DUF188 domain-containing protein [Treponema sp.]